MCVSHITHAGRSSERVRERGCKVKETERERESLAANAWSRLLFSVMAQNDISMIRKNKPTK